MDVSARPYLLAAVFVLCCLASASAQPTPSPTAKPDTPATQPAPEKQDGTAPGNAGSTGWTGGTGGSFVGTSNHAPTPGSKTEQPETVKGLNPSTNPSAPTPR
jgi:hypothetical protein